MVDVDIARDITLTLNLVHLTPAQLGGYDVCVQHGDDSDFRPAPAAASVLPVTRADTPQPTVPVVNIKQEQMDSDSDSDVAMDTDSAHLTNGHMSIEDKCVSRLEVGGTLLSDTVPVDGLLSDSDMGYDDSILHNITPDDILLPSANTSLLNMNSADAGDNCELDVCSSLFASNNDAGVMFSHKTGSSHVTNSLSDNNDDVSITTNGNINSYSSPVTSVPNRNCRLDNAALPAQSPVHDDAVPNETKVQATGTGVTGVNRPPTGDYVKCVDKQGRVIMVPKHLLQTSPNNAQHRVQLKLPPSIAGNRMSVPPVAMPTMTHVTRPASAPSLVLPNVLLPSPTINATPPGVSVRAKVRIMAQPAVRASSSLLRSGSSPSLLRTPVPQQPAGVRTVTARLLPTSSTPVQVSKHVVNPRPNSVPNSRLTVPATTPVAKSSTVPMVSLLKPLHERMFVLPPVVGTTVPASAPVRVTKVISEACVMPASRLISSLANRAALTNNDRSVTSLPTVVPGNASSTIAPVYRTSDNGLTVHTTVGQRAITLEVPADLQDDQSCDVEDGHWEDLWLDTCQLAAVW